jgi:hypothetical protein
VAALITPWNFPIGMAARKVSQSYKGTLWRKNVSNKGPVYWSIPKLRFKGTVSRDFWPSVFLHQTIPPGPLIHWLKPLSNYASNSPRYDRFSKAKIVHACQWHACTIDERFERPWQPLKGISIKNIYIPELSYPSTKQNFENLNLN